MKKYIRYTLCVLCLLSLFTLGLWELVCGEKTERISNDENRMLEAFPALTGESFLSGSFMQDFEAWMTDAFPGRAGAVRFSETLLGIFGSTDENAEIQSALDAEEDPSRTGPETLPVRTEELPAATAEPAAAPGGETPPGDTGADGALWMVNNDGSIEVQASYPHDDLVHIAKVLDMYRDALPEDGTVQFVNVPVSYMGLLLFYGRAAGWGCDADDILRAYAGSGVSVYDATEIFGEDVYTEPLYSGVGDHHWFPRGAWMTASAMLRGQGLVPTDYYEYPYRLESTGKNIVYTGEQLEATTANKRMGDIEVMLPLTPVESYIVYDRTELEPSAYLDDWKIEHYGIYLGGRRGPYRYFVTGYHTGRNALIIGDSFYQAFLPYLTPYYDAILATDPRDDMYRGDIRGSIRDYMEEYDISDVYFVTCSYTSLDGYVFQDRLERLFDNDFAAAFDKG